MTNLLYTIIAILALLLAFAWIYLVKIKKQNSDLKSELSDIEGNFSQRVKERTAHLEKTRDNISEYAIKRFEVAQELESRNMELEKKIDDLKMQSEEIRQAYENNTKLHILRKKAMSMVIHDLKNPLNIILHTAENSENPRNALNKITRVASEMTNLILNTLDMGKFEDSAYVVKCEHFDLVKLVVSICSKFAELCKIKPIELGIDLPDEYPVFSDRQLTSRVLENLLSNACKFTPPFGKICISATALQDMIRIEICDNGAGMHRQMLKKAFDEYVSDDSNAYAYSNSIGIGLAFCRSAVEAQGGRIGIISKKDEGTRVWFN